LLQTDRDPSLYTNTMAPPFRSENYARDNELLLSCDDWLFRAFQKFGSSDPI